MTTPVVVPNPSESVAAAFWRTSWLRKFDWLVLKQQDGGSERPFCKTCQKFLFQNTVAGGNLTSLLRHERTVLHQGKGPMKTSSVQAPPIQDFLDCLDDRAKRKSFRSSGKEKAWKLSWCLAEAFKMSVHGQLAQVCIVYSSAKTLRDRFSPSVSLALWKSRAAGMPVFQGFWLWSMTGGRELLIWHQQLARELRGSSSSTGSHPEVGQGQSLLWNGRCTKPSGRASCLLAAMQRQMRRRPFAFWQAKRLLPQLPRHSVCSQTSKPGWGTTLMRWADSLWNGMWMRPLERPTRSTSGARLR